VTFVDRAREQFLSNC